MENKEEIHGINEFDFNLICEYFSSTQRQGPGSDECTLKALSMIGQLPHNAKVVDLGCGTGSSALLIAKELGIEVTALDLFPRFIDILNERAKLPRNREQTNKSDYPLRIDLVFTKRAAKR